jgi:valyl-tRNA synthetase
MDLRPQAHDIIRTWLFSTVLRSHLEENALPWAHTAISGWVLDPDRKKMSKSKGNVVTPMGLLDEHGSDAVRYWAAKGGPGVDTAFEPGQMKVGRRLAIKLLNASKFVLSKPGESGPILEPLDRGMIQKLRLVVRSVTRDLEAYDYAAALRQIEEFFWWFCDDYIELVKRRRAGDDAGAGSAAAASTAALSVMLRMFAPFLPFVTEEVWSWWQPGSVHRAGWPGPEELPVPADDQAGLAASEGASAITVAIRQARSGQKLGFGIPVRAELALTLSPDLWSTIERDVTAGNNVAEVTVSFEAPELVVRIEPVAGDA